MNVYNNYIYFNSDAMTQDENPSQIPSVSIPATECVTWEVFKSIWDSRHLNSVSISKKSPLKRMHEDENGNVYESATKKLCLEDDQNYNIYSNIFLKENSSEPSYNFSEGDKLLLPLFFRCISRR